MNETRLKGLPYFLVSLFVAYLVIGTRMPSYFSRLDVAGFSQLPVLSGGRIKPLDTVARTSLLLLRGKQSVRWHEKTLSADEWLLDMLYNARTADAYPVFEIDNPDVLGVMGIQQTSNRYYSFTDLHPHLEEIESQAQQAEAIKPDRRSRYQTAIDNLYNRLALYHELQSTLRFTGTTFYPLPFREGLVGPARWIGLGDALIHHMNSVALRHGVIAYATMGNAWQASDAPAFKKTLIEYRSWLDTEVPTETSLSRYEFFFNYFEPFYKSMVIYVTALLLAFVSLLAWPKTFVRSAFYFLVLAFCVHTAGLVSRMILQGRPPVTNLYSSAIFVGWTAVLLGIILERIYRNGIGTMVASAIGFVTLIIAHHLAAQGDTLEMMRAVLDSNFWLATHVVCITIGYGSTFLAGFLAVLYIVRRAFDKSWSAASALELERMVYGIVCFSLLFSFIGTILGGIWADQSWGRFWGWDPKENGALMIVLWNAFILHARIGKLADQRAVMIMAVFGNIVTAFSWFGVNMLGIGLHSYGFMEKAFAWLVIFAVSQILIMALALASARRKIF